MIVLLKFADGREREVDKPRGLPLRFRMREEFEQKEGDLDPLVVNRVFRLVWAGGKPVYVEEEKKGIIVDGKESTDSADPVVDDKNSLD